MTSTHTRIGAFGTLLVASNCARVLIDGDHPCPHHHQLSTLSEGIDMLLTVVNSNKKTVLGRAVLTLFAAVAAFGLMAGPASAAGPLDTDDVLINGQRVDFGNDPHWFGSPQTSARLEWTYSGVTVKALLTGRVYWDATNISGCARVRMTMYNSSGAALGAPTYSGRACRAGLGGLVSKYVELPLSSSAGAHKVVITTQTAPSASSPSSAYTNTGSVTRFFGID